MVQAYTGLTVSGDQLEISAPGSGVTASPHASDPESEG